MRGLSLDRRRFLGTAAALSAALGLFGIGSDGWSWRMRGRELPMRLAGLVRDAASAITVGKAYLSTLPEAPLPAELVDQLMSRPTGLAAGRFLWSDARLRQRIAHRIQADYEANRTVVLDGWVISQAEAELCALTALQADTDRRSTLG